MDILTNVWTWVLTRCAQHNRCGDAAQMLPNRWLSFIIIATIGSVVTRSPPPAANEVTVNCSREVVEVFDSPPIRSPQAVHSLIASMVRGKELVEIGTRNGDGMACFARTARQATALEIEPVYCKKLQERADAQASLAGLHGHFNVSCQPYQTACPDADVYTWWEQLPHLKNKVALSHLAGLCSAGKIRRSAEAIVIFDTSWREDMGTLASIKRHATLLRRVEYDEQVTCRTLYAERLSTKPTFCRRARGAFVVARIPLAKYPRVPSDSKVATVSNAQ